MPAVEDHFTREEWLMKNAITNPAITVDGRGSPVAASRAGYTFGVQGCRNGPWRQAGIVVAENPTDDIGFGIINGKDASLRLIAETSAAAGFAPCDS